MRCCRGKGGDEFRKDYPNAVRLPDGGWLGSKQLPGQGGPGTEQYWVAVLRGDTRAVVVALSLDNLAVGFSLGTEDVDLVTAATVIGVVSLALSLLGLELGARIGEKSGQRGELLGALALIAVGVAVAAGVL